MDAEKFDRLTQALGAGLSRRVAMRAALGTAVLGSLGLNQSDEASAKKKKKKKCKNLGPCQICKKGKKKPKANGTACTPPGGTSGQCANSVCIAQSPPVPPSPPPPGNTCVGLGNACAPGAPSPNACCTPAICARRFTTNSTAPFKCCNGPGSSCDASTAATCCSEGCNTTDNPSSPTCACKGPTVGCDDNAQCCSNNCAGTGTNRTCA
jgi:hypothetical protein